MEAFLWWLFKKTAIQIGWAWLKQVVVKMLRWILGEQYREISDHLGTFKKNLNRGDAAAWLIKEAPDFKRARHIFQEFRTAPNPIDAGIVNAAMSDRLRKEGLTGNVISFLQEKGVTQFPDEQLQDQLIARPDEITEEEQYELDRQFEWMITEFEERRDT